MMASVYQLIVSFFCFAGIHPRWCRMFGILVRHDSYAGYAFSGFRMTCSALVDSYKKPQQVNLILFGHSFGDSLSGKTPQHRNAMIGISANLSGLKALGWSMGEVQHECA